MRVIIKREFITALISVVFSQVALISVANAEGYTSSILGTTGVAPFGIIIDSAGNIYTSNVNSDNVSKLTAAAPAPANVRQSSNLTFAQSRYASDTLSDPDGQLRATVDKIMNNYGSLVK